MFGDPSSPEAQRRLFACGPLTSRTSHVRYFALLKTKGLSLLGRRERSAESQDGGGRGQDC